MEFTSQLESVNWVVRCVALILLPILLLQFSVFRKCFGMARAMIYLILYPAIPFVIARFLKRENVPRATRRLLVVHSVAICILMVLMGFYFVSAAKMFRSPIPVVTLPGDGQGGAQAVLDVYVGENMLDPRDVSAVNAIYRFLRVDVPFTVARQRGLDHHSPEFRALVTLLRSSVAVAHIQEQGSFLLQTADSSAGTGAELLTDMLEIIEDVTLHGTTRLVLREEKISKKRGH